MLSKHKLLTAFISKCIYSLIYTSTTNHLARCNEKKIDIKKKKNSNYPASLYIISVYNKMDAISDRNFYDNPANAAHQMHKLIDETPSLLTVILDVNPLEWGKLQESNKDVNFKTVLSSILVMLNSHLALNSGNMVRLYTGNSYTKGAQLIWPLNSNGTTSLSKNKVINKGIYGQFKKIDDNILNKLEEEIIQEPSRLKDFINKDNYHIRGTIAGAISMALSSINKLQISELYGNMKARILILSISEDNTLPYVSMMNTIFAAQKMKVSLDVCKLGNRSIFLQQASDATNGVYIDIKQPKALIQYLTSAMFIDPMLRGIVVLPTNSDIDFRASCFVTNKVVDIGYVCSVCLCILSMIPDNDRCPTCHSNFNEEVLAKLRRKPKVLPLQMAKKKKE